MNFISLSIALVIYAFWGPKLASVYLLLTVLIHTGRRLMTDSNDEDK